VKREDLQNKCRHEEEDDFSLTFGREKKADFHFEIFKVQRSNNPFTFTWKMLVRGHSNNTVCFRI
jgi:hypothetical protein